MDVISLCAIALTGAVISVILKKSNPEYSMIISLCTGVIIIILIISKLEEITAKVNSFLNIVNIDSLYISVLFKSVGICLLTQFASDSCSDAGENALASKVEFAGKIMVLITAIPLFEQVIQIVLGLIK